MTSRFEPTYEELKLKTSPSLATVLRSFEPTYEELKQLFVEQDMQTALLRFEPTYEELKLQLQPRILELFQVLSLPMRN
ncbi:hypothetical protein THEYE_A1105 [Thermodesulfovibrio yellowstonii DSM 11347]|uniref:Uncharacterized protein n=1 Tax=Thermodesulfovibrio yellowstonii (strain ATCC 51303 / DSM 11347 / YP87) TaxID=289376 RepID=B5YL14_THEYD|nr:hypothetical protein THEYE_A1105 [Thermodesulfovibrio yellowstonii DSM 11347]